jgi:NADPH:quinone reductase-like Zn-dependent oxidoreductase
MAAKNKQNYYFVFVREDGTGLKRISEMLQNRKIETSADKIYDLSEVNQALAKVAGGGSKGKTILSF